MQGGVLIKICDTDATRAWTLRDTQGLDVRFLFLRGLVCHGQTPVIPLDSLGVQAWGSNFGFGTKPVP